MSLIPMNFHTFSKKLTCNSGLYEVGDGGTVFVKVGRVAVSISHFSDYPPGMYKVGDSSARDGMYIIAPLFTKLQQATHSLQLKLAHITQIYELVSKWRSTSGKRATEIVFKIDPDASPDQMVLTVFAEGIPDEFCNMRLTFPLQAQGRHQVAFKFKIKEAIDFLFTAKESKDKSAIVSLHYTPDAETYNQNPVFLTWLSFGEKHRFTCAHQIVPEDQSDKPVERSEDDSFLDDDLEVRNDLVEMNKPKSKGKKKK